MAKVMVSLVSNQTIPNVMLINELKNIIDSYLLLTTEEMEKDGQSHSDRIINAGNIDKNKCSKIFIEPNSISDIIEKLAENRPNRNNEYLVNITGGTKLMAIATMSFFNGFPKSKIIYSFIDSNTYIQISPQVPKREWLFTKKLTLNQYLLAYGLNKIESQRTTTNENLSSKLLNRCIAVENDLNKLPEIKYAHSKLRGKEKVFYSGGWFEEYIFNVIKAKLNLNHNDIALGVKLESKSAKNEFDVVFVYKHTIHVIECKAYFGKANLRQKIEKDLYKLGALDDKFGINVKSYYITNFNLKKHAPGINRSLCKRAEDVKVRFFQMNDLKGDSFINEIK